MSWNSKQIYKEFLPWKRAQGNSVVGSQSSDAVLALAAAHTFLYLYILSSIAPLAETELSYELGNCVVSVV